MCTADQATFTNITDVQVAPDTNATVIKEVAVWMDPAFTDGLFDSCKVGSRNSVRPLVLLYFGLFCLRFLVSSAYVYFSFICFLHDLLYARSVAS